MKKIKVIALDMDGVVNSDNIIRLWIEGKLCEFEDEGIYGNEARQKVSELYKKTFCNSTELIFPELAEKITRICNETDCYIIWSSTWRKLEKYSDIKDAQDMFNRRGLPGNRLIAYTPIIVLGWGGSSRGSEISSWIRNNEIYEIIKCAVIDDRFDAGDNLPKNAKLFQTNSVEGITDEITEAVIKYLK